ncbi:MAG: hypothetical protein H6725_17125 [Sandaracinaceae bacterium]|nr:hypothetical protein [Sandaracinaceae bacterium]
MKISRAAFVFACALTASCVAGCGEDACDPGFEREAGVCVDARLRFVGTWTVSEGCNRSGTANYTTEIALDPAVPDGLLISGFWNAFLQPVRVSLSGDAITIDRQEPDADSFFVQGTGVVSDVPNTFSADYIVSDETDPAAIIRDMCQSTWTKQEGL